MSNKKDMHYLGTKLGIIFAVATLSLVAASMLLGVGDPVIALLATLYKGYAATFLGALMGIIWGFIHGYIIGVVVVFFRKLLKI